MKANDLRLGNLVYYKDKLFNENHIVKLICIGEGDKFMPNQIWYENKEVRGSTHSFDDILPIKLTEEILLKCGFEKHEVFDSGRGYISIYSYKSFFCDLLSDKFEYCRKNTNDIGDYVCLTPLSVPLEFVHQLQNLFYAITGKELEIKL